MPSTTQQRERENKKFKAGRSTRRTLGFIPNAGERRLCSRFTEPRCSCHASSTSGQYRDQNYSFKFLLLSHCFYYDSNHRDGAGFFFAVTFEVAVTFRMKSLCDKILVRPTHLMLWVRENPCECERRSMVASCAPSSHAPSVGGHVIKRTLRGQVSVAPPLS